MESTGRDVVRDTGRKNDLSEPGGLACDQLKNAALMIWPDMEMEQPNNRSARVGSTRLSSETKFHLVYAGVTTNIIELEFLGLVEIRRPLASRTNRRVTSESCYL